MAGSKFPFPWEDGSPATLRGAMYAALILPATQGLGVNIVSEQVVKLKNGEDVTFTREQLESFYPGGQAQHPSLPATYTADSYVLSGDDTLTAAS